MASSLDKNMTHQERTSVQDAIDFFTKNPARHKVRGNAELAVHLNTLKQASSESGFTGHHITQLIDVALSGRISESTGTRLLKLLLPKDTVPSDAVINAVSWMCTDSTSMACKKVIVEWLIIVWDVMEDPTVLQDLYFYMFFFIESEVMCSPVCQLLSMITREHHINIVRVRSLINLINKMGNEPHILALLAVYKSFCPHLVSVNLSVKKAPFKMPAWGVAFRKKRMLQQVTAHGRSTRASTTKKRQQEVVPSSQRPALPSRREPGSQDKKPAVSVQSIETFEELCSSIDNIEMPSQMASVLQDRYLQHVIAIYSEPSIAVRLNFWLHHTLQEEILRLPCPDNPERGEFLLQVILCLEDYLQEGIPICETFLSHYLHIWNGESFRPYIFQLISKIRLAPYPALNDLFLEPLRKLFFTSSVYFKCLVLVCLTDLVWNLTAIELPRYKFRQKIQEVDDTIHSTVQSHDYFSVFSEDVEETGCGLMTIRQVVRFVDRLCSIGLQIEDNALFKHCTLQFYEQIPKLQTLEPMFVEVPSPGVMYSALFSNCVVDVNRLCQTVLSLRSAIQKMRSIKKDHLTEDEKTSRSDSSLHVQNMNSYVLDIADSLWRYKSFSHDLPQRSVFKLLDDKTLATLNVPHLRQSLSLHQHQALLGCAYAFVKETQQSSNVHVAGIKNHRAVYLEYLSHHHFHSFSDFINAVVKPV